MKGSEGDEKEYEVETILDAKTDRRGKRKYFIKWKEDGKTSWVLKENAKNATKLIQAFNKALVRERRRARKSAAKLSQKMQAPTWYHLIKTIDDVEMVDDELFVHFTLKTGRRMRENVQICRRKFPQLLISFYQNNLRWKERS
ncbi:hypothetical protein B0H12DRAFT_1146372 [Mycena haematopus]|nr:hypothetical protein B0H12DRAFT_1146372 [Mycena haematopus]